MFLTALAVRHNSILWNIFAQTGEFFRREEILRFLFLCSEGQDTLSTVFGWRHCHGRVTTVVIGATVTIRPVLAQATAHDPLGTIEVKETYERLSEPRSKFMHRT